MIHNYWIAIMAIAFVLAMGTWLLLLFNADRHPGGGRQESLPHREVIGGEFEAIGGGRQLMPIPGEPIGDSASLSGRPDTRAQPAAPAQGEPRPEVPAQAGEPDVERAAADADRA